MQIYLPQRDVQGVLSSRRIHLLLKKSCPIKHVKPYFIEITFVCSITEQRATLICPEDVKNCEIFCKLEKDLYGLVSLYSDKERSTALQKLKPKILQDLILKGVSIHATPS